MKIIKLITFRPKADEDEAFEKGLEMLGVDRTELARESFRKGFAIAVKKIASRQKENAVKRLMALERAKGFEPSTFTLAR